MLREGRLPGRSFQRLLAGEQQQLAGFVMGKQPAQLNSVVAAQCTLYCVTLTHELAAVITKCLGM
jgi:hypothetical protein